MFVCVFFLVRLLLSIIFHYCIGLQEVEQHLDDRQPPLWSLFFSQTCRELRIFVLREDNSANYKIISPHLGQE
jgi:hypothetical protein